MTTKVAAGIKSYDGAVQAIDGSLTALGLDDIDLMIVHSPQPWDESRGEDRYFAGNREVWRALEEAHSAGKIRAIGISNFQADDIDNILGTCTVAPILNQVLAHISNMPTDVIEYSRSQGNAG